jgi:hypothetical protein
MDGVQKDATLRMDFNPGYQTLTLYWARIWRGAQHLDRLDTNQVKIVQQEWELDQFVLNGQKSAVLVLNDVRVGDIPKRLPVYAQQAHDGVRISVAGRFGFSRAGQPIHLAT